jgi:hypothetical protein
MAQFTECIVEDAALAWLEARRTKRRMPMNYGAVRKGVWRGRIGQGKQRAKFAHCLLGKTGRRL